MVFVEPIEFRYGFSQFGFQGYDSLTNWMGYLFTFSWDIVESI